MIKQDLFSDCKNQLILIKFIIKLKDKNMINVVKVFEIFSIYFLLKIKIVRKMEKL